ncbi:MAG: alpha/beta hydrolase [Bacteroidota bacterium]
MQAMKLYFRSLDLLAPGQAAKKVYHFMSNPQVRKLRDHEEAILDRSEKRIVPFNGFDLQTYRWGNPAHPTVLLVHGWEGQAGNFGALIDILLEKNYYVVAYDAPAHGHSSKGRTSMFASAKFLKSFVQEIQPKVLISHSFGGPTTGLALQENQDLNIEKWIMVTTPNRFQDRMGQLKTFLGLSDRTMSRLYPKIKSDTSFELGELSMLHFSKTIKNVKDILIVHSKSDKILPIEWARQANEVLPNSSMIELDGLGHYGILWSEALKNIIKEQL